MSPTSRLLPRQFSLIEAIAFVTIFAVGLAALTMRLHPLSMMIMGALVGWGGAIVFACRKRLLLFVAVGAILLPFVSLPFWVDAWVTSVRRGPIHTFVLAPTPKFLAENVAMDRARETLALDGLDPDEWKPSEDGRSKSPDGVVDKYLSRNTLNPNSCYIQFVSNTGKPASRIVRLELVENQLTTYVWLPK